jgi:HdeA/HdeB family
MKSLVMLTAAAAIAAAVPAQAQTDGQTPGEAPSQGWTHKVDLSSVLCKELAGLQKLQVEQIVTWLQGFYTLEGKPRIIDPDKIKADVGKLGAYCKQNPEVNLVAAADDVMGEP